MQVGGGRAQRERSACAGGERTAVEEKGTLSPAQEIRGRRRPTNSEGEGRDRPREECSPAVTETVEIGREVPGASLWGGKYSSRRRRWVAGK